MDKTAYMWSVKTRILNINIKYKQSGNKIQLVQSHHHGLSLQELSIKTLTATRYEISSFYKTHHKILENVQ